MPQKKRVTIKDVSAASGHAVSTVSNALAGKNLVTEETRKHIIEVAERMGYRPSSIARSLRLQQSSTIGVIISDIMNPALPEYVRGVEDVATREGWTILLGNTDENLQRQLSQMRTMRDRHVDGLIMIAQEANDPAVRELLQGGPPHVFIQRRSRDFADDYVGADNALGMSVSVSYLYGLGHRRIGLIRGPASSSTANERFEAFVRVRNALGCDPDPDLIHQGDYTIAAGQAAAKHFLSMDRPPTAIVASNDICAIGVQDAAMELGVSIPGDLSLFGCDDIELARLRQFNLTTMHLPKRQIGRSAAELLLERIRNPERPPGGKQIIMESSLQVRGSCRPPRERPAD